MSGPGGNGVVEAAVLGAVKEVEQELDRQLEELNSLQEDDMEAIRRRRLAEMKKRAEEEALWRRRGHGTQVRIAEKDFFVHAKEASRVVVMVTRPGTSRYSQDIEEHFARVAERHLETFFATLDADKSPFLCNKFQLQVMPSIILVKNHEVDKILHGLDAFMEDGKFNTVFVERRLHDLGLLTHLGIADDE